MAYCEIAQKDCPYLDDANRVVGNITLARATSSGRAEGEAGVIEDLAQGVIDAETDGCADEHCGLVGAAVMNLIKGRVTELYKERNQGGR